MTQARNRIIAIFTAITIGFVAGACAPGSSITKVFEDPGFSGLSYENILVVGGAKVYENRAAYERTMSARLMSAGVAAAPLYEIGGGNVPVDRDVILEAVKAGGFDAVLYTHTVDDRTNVNVTKSAGQTTVGANRKSDRVVNLFRYDYEEHADPEFVSFTTSAVLITELYSVSSKTKVWEAEINLAERDSVALLIDDAVSLLIGALKRDKLLAM
jgi:hypothetical protein